MLMQDLQFLLRGGPVMWPLFFCGVVSIAVMIDRFIAIGVAVRGNGALLTRVEELLRAGQTAAALQVCEEAPGRVARLIAGGIRSKHLDHVSLERAMEELALKELPLLRERLSVLDTVVTLAPLLGLLGTITGMIRAFHVVSAAHGLGAPLAITGGVAEALIATAAGLSIAILTLPVYNFLTERVKENVGEMELRATQLLNLLANIKRGEEASLETSPNGA